jgi:hypothetical protein
MNMHHAELTAAVRRRVTETFMRLGAASAEELRESIVIRDGAYCGRRFEGDLGHAVWFLEEDQLKFYRADGGILCVLEPAVIEAMAPVRMAA